MSEPTADSGSGPAELPTVVAGGRVLGRYRLVEPLGQGGAGAVWAATDTLTRDPVAVKFVPPMHEHARLQYRREVAVLLVLRMPGVVRFRDEGIEGRHQVLVTDRVHGVPFSALARRASWWPSVLRLLEILAQVHSSGLVHRDLKPGNVLVDADGQPTILDFGLARGAAAPEPGLGRIEGTPRYMAPEQRHADAPLDARTDLYAVGLMVLELLTEAPPSESPDLRALDRSALPPTAKAVLRSMLAADPADRPDSALAVLAALDSDPLPDPERRLGPGPWGEEALRELFVDVPHSITHVAIDGARALHRAAGGEAQSTMATIRSWALSGHVRWHDGRLLVTRDALARLSALDAGSPERAIAARVTEGVGDDELVERSLERAAALHRSGSTRAAIALLDGVAPVVRGTHRGETLLTWRIAHRLSLRLPHEVDVAMHTVTMATLPPRSRGALMRLLRGARAALTGDPDAAMTLLQLDPGLPDPLKRHQQALRLRAASWADAARHDEVSDAAGPWLPPAARDIALGIRAYRQCRFEHAARYAERVAADAPSVAQRINGAIVAAASRSELGQFSAAWSTIAQAEALARTHRHVRYQDEARWHRRLIAYRGALRVGVCPALVDAAAALGPAHEGRMAFVEALLAWRSGQWWTARRLAGQAARALPFDVGRPLVVLAHAFASAMGAASEDDARIATATAGLDDEFAVQICALLAMGQGRLTPGLRRGALQRLEGLERVPDRRLDVLSPAECRRVLTGPDSPARSTAPTR